jgi:large subunit ribosomal protein L21
MYAIIKTGGKQYFVTPGDRLFIEKLEVESGDKIEFDKVLYLSTDDSAKTGTPYLDAVRVLGTVVENGKAKKVVTFKYKAKKDYRKKQGHRQPYTLVEIDSVTSDGKTIAEKPVPAVDEIAPAVDESEPVVTSAEPDVESAEPKIENIEPAPEAAGEDVPAFAAEEKPPAKKTRPRTVKADVAMTEDDKAETSAEKSEEEKPAVKKPSKPRAPKKDAEKSDADETEAKPAKPAVKRTPKPKAEKPDAKAEEQEPAAEKPAEDKGDNL